MHEHGMEGESRGFSGGTGRGRDDRDHGDRDVPDRIADALEEMVRLQREGGSQSALARLKDAVDALGVKVDRVLNLGVAEMAKVDDLIGHVREQTTVIGSVGVFIQELRDLIAQGGTPAQIDELLAGVQGNNTQLRAFVENTPAVVAGRTE